ncbi:hypothetical protein AVEN_35210-1 [Araneus ventricosus]|uniref:Uncharacterized protein n=1 Tax=Araneus ventricosus TaxID=182803 RepID=A0A4Y2U399_ARAVE|nr:hypothetical protein AVEN_35210-1 [Araneus ventricosus]
MGDSVFDLEATIDELGCNIDRFLISKSSIQRIERKTGKEPMENIKLLSKTVPDGDLTLGRLFPALSARKSKEERLPIVMYGLKNNSLLCQIILPAKNRHRLFGRRS